jgi:hypothetical protein
MSRVTPGLIMFVTVHRTRNGWIPSCPQLHFSTEAEALELLPTIAELVNRPASAIKVVPEQNNDGQLV